MPAAFVFLDSAAAHREREGGSQGAAGARARAAPSGRVTYVPPRTAGRRRCWRRSGRRCLRVDASRHRRQLLRAGRRLDPEHPGRRARPRSGPVTSRRGISSNSPPWPSWSRVWRRTRGSQARGCGARGGPPDADPALVLRAGPARSRSLEPGLPVRDAGGHRRRIGSKPRSQVVARHHDALRLRFRRTPTAGSRPTPKAPAALALERVDLSSRVPKPSGRAPSRSRRPRCSSGLNLERGPLARGGPGRPGAGPARPAAARHPPPRRGRRLVADPARGRRARICGPRGGAASLPARDDVLPAVVGASRGVCRGRGASAARCPTG